MVTWDTLCVEVLDVLPEQASQVVFAEHGHVIEQLSANRSHEALWGESSRAHG